MKIDGDWGLGIGDWGLGCWGHPPIPKTQTPKILKYLFILIFFIIKK